MLADEEILREEETDHNGRPFVSKFKKRRMKEYKDFMETYMGCGCITIGCFIPMLLLSLATTIGLIQLVVRAFQ